MCTIFPLFLPLTGGAFFPSPMNSLSSFRHLCYFVPPLSGLGLFQDTSQVRVPLSAPVFVVLRASEEVPPSPEASLPEGEAFLQNMHNFMCLSVILIHSACVHICVCVCLILQVCANFRDMCVLFAGPFPAGFSEREVRRLFCCCGPVRKIKMLNTAVRVLIIAKPEPLFFPLY